MRPGRLDPRGSRRARAALRLTLWLAAAAAAPLGCGNDFRPASYLGGLRLLGVVADPPELGAGATARLEAIPFDPGPEPLRISWAACLTPPVPSTGDSINRGCLEDDHPGLAPLGEGPSVDFTMPTLDLGQRGFPDATAGFYLPVRLRLDAGPRHLQAFYQVRYDLGLQPPNHNPVLEAVLVVPPGPDGGAPPDAGQGPPPIPLVEGEPIELAKDGELTLEASVAPGSAEPYLTFDGDPREMNLRTVNELIRVSWFSTAGTFSEEVTSEDKPRTTFRADDYLPELIPPEGVLVELYVVARDERGGTSFTRRQLRLR